MNPDDLDPSNICCSRLRPPDVGAIEHKCRRVWPNWDDYPPVKKSPGREIEREPQAAEGEIKRTKHEVAEMVKRLVPKGDVVGRPPQNAPPVGRTGGGGLFRESQPMPTSAFVAYHRTYDNGSSMQDDGSSDMWRSHNPSVSDVSDRRPWAGPEYRTSPMRAPPGRNITSETERPWERSPTRAEMQNEDSFARGGQQTHEQSREGDGDCEVQEIVITAAEILEARILRQQNEEMRDALQEALERLDAIKLENRQLLTEIERGEEERRELQRQRHDPEEMSDY